MEILLLCLFQTCGAGFFLAQSGECLPCDCNGNSNECLDGSGLCVVGRGHFSQISLALCILGGNKIFFLDIGAP